MKKYIWNFDKSIWLIWCSGVCLFHLSQVGWQLSPRRVAVELYSAEVEVLYSVEVVELNSAEVEELYSGKAGGGAH